MKKLSSFVHDVIPTGPEVLLKPILSFILSSLAERHPQIFERLGAFQKKRFLINPTDMPFVLMLAPDSAYPRLLPYRSKDEVSYDASISGAFSKLKDLIDGKLDGDALFFSRDLMIEGDTEAVLALRNAIDDLELNIIEELSTALGPFSMPITLAEQGFEKIKGAFSK